MLNSLNAGGTSRGQDWKWTPSRQAFINKWGREVRCAAVGPEDEKGALKKDIQRDILNAATGAIAVASVPIFHQEEAKAIWREMTVEENKKALRME